MYFGIDKEYFECLGLFAHQFARTESALHFEFVIYSGIPQPLARIWTGGMRLVDLMKATRQMIEANEWEASTKSEMNTLLQQLNTISRLRNQLLHRGAKLEAGGLVSTNDASYRKREDREVYKFVVQDLKDATRDLRCIEIRLFKLHWDFSDDETIPQNIREDMKRLERQEIGELFGTWRYRAVQPEAPDQPPQT